MIVHFLNGKTAILKDAEHYCFNGDFIEFLNKEDAIIAVINARQMIWIDLLD